MLVNESNSDEVEVMAVQIKAGQIPIRIITGYGPKEGSPNVYDFYSKVEEEIENSMISGCATFVEMDFNAKLGGEIIKGDKHEMSSNGKLLKDLIDRNDLVVVNATDKCSGLITRMRKTINGVEESVIDYVIMCKKLFTFLSEMKIDDKREKVLTNFTKKENEEVTEADHNVIECTLNIKVEYNKESSKKEIQNLRNEENIMKFKDLTEDDTSLLELFNNDKNIKVQGKNWFKNIKYKISKAFPKIKIDTGKKETNNLELQQLINRRMLKKKEIVDGISTTLKHKIEDDIDIIEKKIASFIASKNAQTIKEHVEDMCAVEGSFSSNKMWKLKKKVYARGPELPTAKKDPESGMLISNPQMLKELNLRVFKNRLKSQEIRPNLTHYKNLREELLNIRLQRAKLNKSNNWTMSDLDKVLKTLKDGKCKDPAGLVNELFTYKNIGNNLKESLLTSHLLKK